MISDIYCAICGAPFYIPTILINNINYSQYDFTWLSVIRIPGVDGIVSYDTTTGIFKKDGNEVGVIPSQINGNNNNNNNDKLIVRYHIHDECYKCNKGRYVKKTCKCIDIKKYQKKTFDINKLILDNNILFLDNPSTSIDNKTRILMFLILYRRLTPQTKTKVKSSFKIA